MPDRPVASGLVRVVLAAAIVLAVGSQIVMRTLGAYLSEVMPQEAISLGLAGPGAYLAAAAEMSAARAQPEGDKGTTSPPGQEALELARDLVRHALHLDPTSASGWRILGSIEDGLGDRSGATLHMERAARRSLRESDAHFWLLLRSYERKDAVGALARAETMLLARSSALQALMPALVWIASMPDGSVAIDRVLAANPPWRQGFFELLPQHISDARLPLRLLLALKSSRHPPEVRDLRPYLALLLRHKLYELANYAWLQFLPPARVPETGMLFNGAFEHAPSGLPFDWVIEGGTGVSVDIQPREDLDGRKALVLEFGDGRAELRAVRQQILLAPGAYVLKGRAKGRLIARRGLQWRITCADSRAEPIGRSQLFAATIATWTGFTLAFTVPGEDCRSQIVSLVLEARSASEQLVQGSMSFTDLKIDRGSH